MVTTLKTVYTLHIYNLYMTHTCMYTTLQIYKTIANTRIINVYGYRCYDSGKHQWLAGIFPLQCVFVHYSTCQKKSPVSVPFRFISRSVPFRFSSRFNRSGPFRSVHFRSNRLPRANSFSARHEFVCKIHCVRWRSIARLFSTTRSRDGFFLP